MGAAVVAGASLAAAAAAGPFRDYGARVDPWLKEWSQVVRVAEDTALQLRLHTGRLTALDAATGKPAGLGQDQLEVLLEAVFPAEARAPPVTDEAWARRVRLHAAAELPDPACAVNGENHLEGALLEVFRQLGLPPRNAVLNLGGLYGGQHGAGGERPDDPTVELMRHLPGARALCWGCGDVAAVTRAGGAVARRFEAWDVDVLSEDLEAPPAFRDLDLLRLDALPGGASCSVLARLLRSGARPRAVAMLVQSQVPPPFRYTPLGFSDAGHPPALFSCSLAAAAGVVEPFGLSLLRLTGPYALFVERGAWPGGLPLNDLDCYRRASIWGSEDLPAAFVREWLFAPPREALPRLWGNLTLLYEAAGSAGVPFALAL